MDKNKTKAQLIEELVELKSRYAELESAALKNQQYPADAVACQSPQQWFFTGRSEFFVNNSSQKVTDNCVPVKYRLADLVDVESLQQLLKSFYKATGIPHGLHDESNTVMGGIGWQDICNQ